MTGEYYVGVRIRAYSGGGHLLIGPGYLALRPSGVMAALGAPRDVLVHTKSLVMVYRSRFTLRSGIVVEAESETGLAIVPSWTFKPIATHLELAGFNFQVERTSWSIGAERVAPWEL